MLAWITAGTCFLGPSLAAAAPEGSGLPLPRFVSLRSGLANLRTGPGERYPITWVYQRRGLPLEIVAEYHHWRQVRDWEGTLGWMHASMLSSRRHVIIIGSTSTLRTEPRLQSPARALLEAGVLANVLKCPGGSAWCLIKVQNGIRGWVERTSLWGVYDGESIE